jgi:hypothetical protein
MCEQEDSQEQPTTDAYQSLRGLPERWMIRFWRDQVTYKTAIIVAQEAQIQELTHVKLTLEQRCQEYEERLRHLHQAYQERIRSVQKEAQHDGDALGGVGRGVG